MASGTVGFFFGLLLAIAVVVTVAVGARTLRRRYLPRWDGPHGLLATVVIAITMIMGTSTVLGVVRSFRLVPVAATLVALTVVVVAADRRAGPRAPLPEPADGPIGAKGGEASGRFDTVISGFAAAAVVVAVAEWGLRTWWALGHGIHTIDSLWYHLPFAARWVQTEDLTQIHYPEAGPLTAFFPANGSIPHALGMMFLGNDLASVFINLGWLALALLAAWCIGQPFGVAKLSLGTTAVICVTPGLLATQPGGAYSDIVGIALLLASVALIVTALAMEPDRARPPYVIAAAAAGLAFGTKYQFIIPVAALTAAVVALGPASARLRRAVLWIGTLVVTGSYWYLRTWIRVGNPLPAMELELEPVERRYIMFTPLSGRLATRVDRLARSLPIGAQHYVAARQPL